MTHTTLLKPAPPAVLAYILLIMFSTPVAGADVAVPNSSAPSVLAASASVPTATCSERLASWTPDPAVTAELASSPQLLKQKLEEAMRAVVKDPKLLDIRIVEYSPEYTSRGRLKQVIVNTEGGEVDGLILHRASFNFDDVQLDTTKLLREAKIDTIAVCNIDMDVLILESDMNAYLGEKARKIKVDNPRVELATGQLILSGSTKYSLVKVNFWATGNFEVRDSQQIWFHAKKMKLNSMSMPRAFIGTIIKRINPVLNLEKFPFRLNLKEIRIEKGALHFISTRKGE
ncbi:MAG TPA: DUF2993 domain-containing protein [Candidatus Ozemobacteraceae bacterium]|nr:DUF2993 domain-containing protein [Candidatus Ozemobacteraceae bacterium]HQG27540.1 DUF2993 domain-containing protein [Candidatus Ozemobacteraceae bacterium]